MPLSQRCQYAVRAVFELAKRQGTGATKIGDIAEAQAIPTRFLENILNHLKCGGFVESVRGKDGGYLLARSAKKLAIGEIVRFIDVPLTPVDCSVGGKKGACSMYGHCAFLALWKRAQDALEAVYDGTTFHDLVVEEAKAQEKSVLDFAI